MGLECRDQPGVFLQAMEGDAGLCRGRDRRHPGGMGNPLASRRPVPGARRNRTVFQRGDLRLRERAPAADEGWHLQVDPGSWPDHEPHPGRAATPGHRHAFRHHRPQKQRGAHRRRLGPGESDAAVLPGRGHRLRARRSGRGRQPDGGTPGRHGRRRPCSGRISASWNPGAGTGCWPPPSRPWLPAARWCTTGRYGRASGVRCTSRRVSCGSSTRAAITC